jgi:radical S-adenosyl methionine domain-containing protein 2
MVPEDNTAMIGSYMMIDPLCRLYDNVGQVHHYSRPIPEIGLAEAVREIVINLPAFEARGGSYQWKEGVMAEL